jgi:inosine triphosphate pyrophosphatase
MLMSNIYFFTGNAGKLREIQNFLPHVEGVDLDLVEVQSTDPECIIRHKLAAACDQVSTQDAYLLVEDTSLYLDCLGGLPGPLIKWFIQPQHLGVKGLADIAQRLGNPKAQAVTVLGLHRPHQEPLFVSGSVDGLIVSPRGAMGFGWDSIFQPLGQMQTFAEMVNTEKQQWSMRRQAVLALLPHLNQG